MSLVILERTIRSFVARGSGLDPLKVVPGREEGTSAPDDLYASVTLRMTAPKGRIGRRQVVGESDSYVIHSQLIDSAFDIQFYRAGANEAARRFEMWARSESGITWAATALSCGRLAGANVYEGGSGYVTGEQVEFHHHADDVVERVTPVNAFGVISAAADGSLSAVRLTSGGTAYSIIPEPVFLPPASGTGAVVSPRGFGFAIERVKTRNLTNFLDDVNLEEVAQIDLDVCHTAVYNDDDSGRVERIISDNDF